MTTFTACATRLAGASALLLGWRPDDFWNATPAELMAVLNAMRGEADEPVDLAALMAEMPD